MGGREFDVVLFGATGYTGEQRATFGLGQTTPDGTPHPTRHLSSHEAKSADLTPAQRATLGLGQTAPDGTPHPTRHLSSRKARSADLTPAQRATLGLRQTAPDGTPNPKRCLSTNEAKKSNAVIETDEGIAEQLSERVRTATLAAQEEGIDLNNTKGIFFTGAKVGSRRWAARDQRKSLKRKYDETFKTREEAVVALARFKKQANSLPV